MKIIDRPLGSPERDRRHTSYSYDLTRRMLAA